MIELFGLAEKLRSVNGDWWPVNTLYLYRNPVYYTIYDIIGFYKNYSRKSWTPVQKKFNKAMAKLQIKAEYIFVIYQNL